MPFWYGGSPAPDVMVMKSKRSPRGEGGLRRRYLASILFGLAAFVVLAGPAAADPPVLTGQPPDITAEASGPSGATVSFDLSNIASDDNGQPNIVCSPGNGTVFPLGSTSVSCTFTDPQTGQTTIAGFNISVVDTTPPAISGTPAGISVGGGASGAVVTYSSPTATDAVDVTDPVNCAPMSGSTFPIGTTTVTCTATDTHGNSSQTSFTITVQNTPPVISGTPANLTVQATAASGATVTYANPTATDAAGSPIPVSCLPLSGSTFPIGTTTVTCTATDTYGNSSQTSFTITVQNTPPVISGTPANLTVQATAASGATVTYANPTATDAAGSPIPVSCLPLSGSTFPIGTTTVTCTATDTVGNSSQSTFTVLVQDTVPPVINVPGPLDVAANGPTGAITTFAVSATDAVDGPVPVVCTPPSGSMFPLGQTSVTCTAKDAAGNSAAQSFIVTVTDTLPPVLNVPGTIAIQANSTSGAVVTFSVTGLDAVDGPVPVVCRPPSGSTFPMGQTSVTCTAKDAAGNSAHASFIVSVTSTPPPTPPADRTPPVLTVPSDITAQAQAPVGTAVAFSVSAVDVVDGSVPATCSPASGAVFPVGVTTVRCSAQDARGNTAAKTFTVTIVDRIPPPAVVGLTVQAAGGHTLLHWQNPRSPDIDHIELVRTRLPSGPTVVLFHGMGTSYLDTRFQDGVHYRYTVFTVDTSGNRSGVAVTVAGTALVLVRPADGARVSSPPVLLWVPAPKADYYNVQLYRNGSKILSAWPSTNHYALLARWTYARQARSLSAGVYHWYVWPGYGVPRSHKFGALMGVSTFVVTG